MPFLAILIGVYVLPEKYSFDASGSVLYALLGLTADTVHASVAGAFGYNFTHFRVEENLGSSGRFLTVFGVSTSPSCSAVSCSGRVQETLDLLWDDFRNFPYYRYARSTVDFSFMRQSTEPSLMATCSVLYVALESLKMRIFWELTFRVISAFSAYLLDSGYMYGVSLRGCALVDYNGGEAGFAGYVAPRAVQWHVQGGFRISRCVPLAWRQAQAFRHHGVYGPEGQFLRSHTCGVHRCSSWTLFSRPFWRGTVVAAYRLVGKRVTRVAWIDPSCKHTRPHHHHMNTHHHHTHHMNTHHHHHHVNTQ